MKISKPKQELARIISENGGWRDGADTCSCDQDGYVSFFVGNPTRNGGSWLDNGDCEYIGGTIATKYEKIKNWHQTILSREEYFHLYPAPDADGWIDWSGGECPVDKYARIDIRMTGGTTHYDTDTHWGWNAHSFKITHYRLHKPEQVKSTAVGDDKTNLAAKEELEAMEHHPSIEQLMQIHSDRSHALSEKKAELLVAERQELEAFEALKAACREAGFDIAPITAKQEPELVVTDWRDLQVGDVVWCGGDDRLSPGEYHVMEIEVPDYEGYRAVLVNDGDGGHWIDTSEEWRLIRRP